MTHPHAFGPSELHDLGNAFEAAWMTLLIADGDELKDRPAMRRLLAQRIMEAAANGVSDPKRLKEYALQDLLGPSRTFR